MTTNFRSALAIEAMFKRVLQFCPDGLCPYCNKDVLAGTQVTEKTEIVTCCPHPRCKKSFVD